MNQHVAHFDRVHPLADSPNSNLTRLHYVYRRGFRPRPVSTAPARMQYCHGNATAWSSVLSLTDLLALSAQSLVLNFIRDVEICNRNCSARVKILILGGLIVRPDAFEFVSYVLSHMIAHSDHIERTENE